MTDVTLPGAGGGGTTTITFTDPVSGAAAQVALNNAPPAAAYTGTQPLPNAPTTIVIGDGAPPDPGTIILSTANTPVIVVNTTTPVAIQGSGLDGQTVVAGSGGLNFATGGGSATVIAAGGDNTLGTGIVDAPVSFITGAGNDTLILFAGQATVNAGDGNNFIGALGDSTITAGSGMTASWPRAATAPSMRAAATIRSRSRTATTR
jgi:hypothetical protein